MYRYLGRRVLHSVGVLLGVLVLVFFLVQLVGDPVRLMLPSEVPNEVYVELRRSLGLDRPVLVQFWDALSGWVRGDFGDSLWQGVPALPLAASRIPATLLLTFATMVVAVPAAVLLGVLSAVRPGSIADRIATVVSLAGVSIAEFWLALVLILFFSVELGWFPTSGSGGLIFVVLPAVSLMFRPLGRIAQVTRSALVEQLEKPYVLTARAKGAGDLTIVRRHALKNASIPAVTVLGDELAVIINGAVVIETIFAWPGIGSLFIAAIERRDLPLIVACVFLIAVMVVVLNLLIDLLYLLIDPRTRSS
ncbi:MAG: ABC transporter permease [Dehalococcoidia bacterium]